MQWKPSPLAVPVVVKPHDIARAQQENTLRPFNISRASVGGIDRAAAGYQTEAEQSVAPFLARNMRTDYQNRHLQDRRYLVLPGGDTLYHTPQDVAKRQDLPIPSRFRMMEQRQGGHQEPQVPTMHPSMPTPQESFGHFPKKAR